MAKTKYGSIEDLLTITKEDLQPIVSALRALILSVDSNAVEVVRLGERTATYGLGPRKMKDGYVYILPYSSWVNLGFYQGALLNDPSGVLEGTGKKLRHIKMRNLEDTQVEMVEKLIRAALEERKGALGI